MLFLLCSSALAGVSFGTSACRGVFRIAFARVWPIPWQMRRTSLKDLSQCSALHIASWSVGALWRAGPAGLQWPMVAGIGLPPFSKKPYWSNARVHLRRSLVALPTPARVAHMGQARRGCWCEWALRGRPHLDAVRAMRRAALAVCKIAEHIPIHETSGQQLLVTTPIGMVVGAAGSTEPCRMRRRHHDSTALGRHIAGRCETMLCRVSGRPGRWAVPCGRRRRGGHGTATGSRHDLEVDRGFRSDSYPRSPKDEPPGGGGWTPEPRPREQRQSDVETSTSSTTVVLGRSLGCDCGATLASQQGWKMWWRTLAEGSPAVG